MTTNEEITILANTVRGASSWDACMDEFAELMNIAGRRLREMISEGDDCSAYFTALRKTVDHEFIDGTPDVSEDTPDLIDWLRNGAENADATALGYFIQDLLQADLGL